MRRWRPKIRNGRFSQRLLQESSEHTDVRAEQKFIDLKLAYSMLAYGFAERPPPVNFMPLVSRDE